MSEEKKETVLTAEVVGEMTSSVYEENGIVLYENYDELISKIKFRLEQEVECIVWSRWTLGAHVKALTEQASYGSHTMDDLVNDIGLSKQTLYACKTLFETYDRSRMEDKIIPNKLSFRALNYISRVSDEDQRDYYIEEVSSGNIKAEDIPSLESNTLPAGAGVTEDSGSGDSTKEPASTPQSPEANAASAIRKAMGAVDAPLDLLTAAIQPLEMALDKLDEVAADDDLYETVREELAVVRTRLANSQPSVEGLIKRLDDKT